MKVDRLCNRSLLRTYLLFIYLFILLFILKQGLLSDKRWNTEHADTLFATTVDFMQAHTHQTSWTRKQN